MLSRKVMRTSPLLSLLLLASACVITTKSTNKPPASSDSSAVTDGAKDLAVAPSPPLPFDSEVRMGTLANGMTYYIRRHQKPEQRAALWLAVDAGSVVEDDDQKGLAHFVEHMAFNGTERFEKNTLIDFVERAGMDFGADLNAYTSFDETVYMLTVPTDDAKTFSTGMDIIEDWAHALTFDPAEVDKERGVVIEEWRLGRGASQRAFDKQWPIFLKGSKYAERKPIGEKKILETAPVETLQRFYKDWYRPDLMAVIVVGDIDVDTMEADIKRRFGAIKGPEAPRERVNEAIPLLEETRAAVVTDPEQSLTIVRYAIKGPLTPIVSEADYRNELVERLMHGMLNARFSEIAQKPDSPFAFTFNFTESMGRQVDLFQTFGFAKPGMVEQTLKVITTEIERARRHGFLATEFDRQKTEMLRNYERALKEKDKADARAYTFEIVSHFLEGEAMPGRAAELELAKKFLPTITLEEVNKLVEQWTNRKDRIVMTTGAARDQMPSEQQLLAIVERASAQEIKAYEEAEVADTLIAEAPKAGTITGEKKIDGIDVTVWTLSNGAKVVIKPTNFKNDELLFRAISPGGTSLSDDRNYWSANMSDSIVANSGLADFDAATLEKMMAGKVAHVSPYVYELEEGLRGSASPDDLEAMMQLIHLTFTAPRKDLEAFEAWKGTQTTFVKNRDLDPQTVFFDELRAFSDKNHLRSKPLTMETLATIDLDAAMKFYADRFGDAGDFTFLFVGNVDLAKLRELSATYLASLPTKGRKEKWRDVGKRHPSGTQSLEVKKGQDPKSFVMLNYHGKARWSANAEDDLNQLSEVLDIRLREVLREEMGGVYGAFSWGSIDRRPRQRYSYTIGFGCGPENVDKLKKAVFGVIETTKKEGIGDEYISKIKELRRRKLEINLKENRFWLSELTDAYRYGSDPRKIVELEEKAIKRVSSANVKAAAKKYLGKNRIDGTLWPETTKTNASTKGSGKNSK
ncbi:MAG TPA: insulinase family protein, partial [Nannocystis exedens]|nr:insulinase family protein [Nannocystis exedens]